ncbi:MAG: phosphate/phosphite/phosphonate ABC transporter substrate-binding protein [Chloroflexi bacterium]|nr:phosphate/phosphite/phosphonate ABC transporter substrate-binding protein [Chloroflexota bacterium]
MSVALIVGFLAVGCVAPTTTQLTAGQSGEVPSTLRVGLIPNQAPDRVRAQYEPFRAHLSRVLGQPVETFVATDYTGVVETMASDKLDLAYFGGLTYVQAEQRANVHPIVTEVDRETGTTRYYSAIIVRSDSPYQRLEDLRGKPFAFGDISSTSGSLYPRIMLDRVGFGDFTNPQLFVYSGGHDATLAAVINATVEAGGLEKRIMERAFEVGTFRSDQIRVLQQAEVQGYPWVVRAKLDAGLVERITDAFLTMDDPELLRLMRAERYERVTAGDYDEVRQQAARLDLVRR